MATLISSKQIQGVVTASVIHGQLFVSGNIILTGSQFVTNGSISASAVTASQFYGKANTLNFDETGLVSGSVLRNLDGTGVFSGSSQVTLSSTTGFTAFSSSVASDIGSAGGNQTLSFNTANKRLTISGGNNVDLSSLGGGGGGGSSIWTADGDKYRVSSNLEVTGSFLATSLTGSLNYSNLTNVPTLVSGSSQVLGGSGVVSGSVVTTLDGTGVVSGSVLRTLDGTGVVSGSVLRTLDGTGVVSGSVLRTLDGTNVVSGSVLRTLDGTDVISGSAQITAFGFVSESSSVPAGTISGSKQISDFGFISSSHTDIAQLNQFTASIDTTIKTKLDADAVVSGSVLRTLDGTGVVSGSVLRTLDGTNVISGSSQVNADSITNFDTNVKTKLDADGVVSGSVVRTLDGTDVVSGSVVRTLDGTGVVSGSVVTTLDGTDVISGSAQITNFGFISGSSVSASISFNGNKVVSNEKLPQMFSQSFNPGTSGSVQDFLNAVFFPNTAPSITTGNQTIEEFRTSGSAVVTLAGTDAEGQSLTFSTASSYTADKVRVASGGEITLTELATSESFNTALVGGVHGHLVTVKATDTFLASTEKDIYIIVTPNEAPKFRETSVVGNVITNVTSSVNENSTNSTLIKRIFFTDAESDTITINSSSISPAGGASHFTITKSSTYVDITQNTGSLDYETYPLYTLSLTASDEHKVAGQDSESFVTLPVSISVVDNVHPTINNQTLSSINENSSNGATVGTISATDSEGDTIEFFNFALHKLELDNGNVASGSYGGTSQLTDPHENPFQCSTSGVVTRRNGVFINSDLVNEYQYRIQVRDSYNTASNEAIVTIPITDDTPATITDNWSAGPYIKESELSGSTIKTTNYGSTQADYNANQSGTWSSSNPAIAINSSGNLSLALNLSGSTTQSGETIGSTITFTNAFGTTTTDSLSVSVVANEAPSISFSNSTFKLNTNLATTNTTMVSMSVSDTENDTPFSASLTGTDAASLSLVYSNANSSSIGLHAASNLTAKTYNYNIKITDSYGKSQDYNSQTFTVAQADTGTLGGDTTSYIIESAVSGATIRDASGYNAGNASQLTVSYSPSYGSPAVATFTSSNEAIAIDNSGNLTLALNLSGSTTQSTDTITSNITFADQYNNIGSGSVTVNVFANAAPTATFTNQTANFETDNATTNATMVSMSISDTESDTPFSASLSGTDAASLKLVYANANSSSVGIQAASNLTAKTYSYNVKVTDAYSKSTEYNGRSFTVVQSADYGRVFVYDVGFNNATYNTAVGISSEDGSTPPVATPYSNIGFVDAIINDNRIGSASFTYDYGGTQTATRLAEASGSNLHSVLRSMGSSGIISRNSSKHFVIFFPSGSDMGGIPTTTTAEYGDNTVGRYTLEVGVDGTTIDGVNTIESSEINQMTLGTSHVGYTKWFMVGARNQVASSTSINLGLSPSSGSGGV